jgi:deoxyribodipyrimidine photo-lyase
MPTGSASRPTVAIVWFRRDLRVGDNPAWADGAGLAEAGSGFRRVALYVLDPVLLGSAGAHRRAQLFGELHALDAALRERGGRLLVRTGDPTVVVPAETRQLGARSVIVNADPSPYATTRDDAVRAALEAAGVEWRAHWGTYVHAPGRIRTAKGTISRVFTPFSKVWFATPLAPWPFESGNSSSGEIGDDAGDGLPTADASPFTPGEREAQDRLAAFERDRVDEYIEQRDVPSIDGTAQISVALRWGTISPRYVLETIGTHTAGRLAFVRQLAWRDWYASLVTVHPDLAHRPIDAAYSKVQWEDDDAGFAAWTEGRTGYPIVDAGMRQLAATGWMHNRVRMITASFLVKDLLIDWRRGEKWVREQLADADIPQNAGNWQWVAGTGADAAPYFRIFNPTAQSRRFDPQGAYIRQWVPELRAVPDRWIHEPSAGGPLELAAYGVTLGAEYPAPVVDHAEARARCLAAYGAARGR